MVTVAVVWLDVSLSITYWLLEPLKKRTAVQVYSPALFKDELIVLVSDIAVAALNVSVKSSWLGDSHITVTKVSLRLTSDRETLHCTVASICSCVTEEPTAVTTGIGTIYNKVIIER